MSDTRTHKFLIAALPWYIAAVTTVIAGLSALAIRNTTRIDQNTTKIQSGLTRVCERENPIRAEAHVVYIVPPANLPESVRRQLAAEPALAYFLAQSAKQQNAGRLRTKEGLPILDCSPNLVGGSARVLSKREQDAYIRAYSRRRLDPITGLPRRR